MNPSVDFPIGFVSLATGLSAHVIRAWERRYQAVVPRRSAAGRRLYSQADIERFILLKSAVDLGHGISHVAGLDRDGLADLTERVYDIQAPPSKKTPRPQPDGAHPYVDACLQAIETLDANALHQGLQQAALALGRQVAIVAVITPVMAQVGRRWSAGTLRVVHEHLASRVIQSHLCRLLDSPVSTAPSKRPRIIVGTPAGQWCQLGALAAAVTARDHGWEPVFLGPDLPAEEIAAACSILDPQMVALSITCRTEDAFLQDELRHLATLLPGRCPLVVGGRAGERYRPDIEAAGGSLCSTTDEFMSLLH